MIFEKNVFSPNNEARFILNSNRTNDYDKANILLISGSSMVSPELFDSKDLSISPNYDVEWDVRSVQLFNKAIRTPNIKMIIGLNAGALIACAMAGGKIIQGITNHNLQGVQRMKGNIGEYLAPSKHDQMMYPYNLKSSEYEVIMHSMVLSTKYLGEDIPLTQEEDFKEPEYVLFKNFNKPVLAIMPEINRMRLNTRTVRMTNQLIDKYLKNA